MPKIKTNRTAYKKFRGTAKGKHIKRGQASTSHNTAKKPQKQMRRLRGLAKVDTANIGAVRRQLPYVLSKKH